MQTVALGLGPTLSALARDLTGSFGALFLALAAHPAVRWLVAHRRAFDAVSTKGQIEDPVVPSTHDLSRAEAAAMLGLQAHQLRDARLRGGPDLCAGPGADRREDRQRLF